MKTAGVEITEVTESAKARAGTTQVSSYRKMLILAVNVMAVKFWLLMSNLVLPVSSGVFESAFKVIHFSVYLSVFFTETRSPCFFRCCRRCC